MTTQDTATHENAKVRIVGGAAYLLLDPTMRDTLGVKLESRELKEHDTVQVRAIGKHGPFMYLYSPAYQKRWQKEQKKRHGD